MGGGVPEVVGWLGLFCWSSARRETRGRQKGAESAAPPMAQPHSVHIGPFSSPPNSLPPPHTHTRTHSKPTSTDPVCFNTYFQSVLHVSIFLSPNEAFLALRVRGQFRGQSYGLEIVTRLGFFPAGRIEVMSAEVGDMCPTSGVWTSCPAVKDCSLVVWSLLIIVRRFRDGSFVACQRGR